MSVTWIRIMASNQRSSRRRYWLVLGLLVHQVASFAGEAERLDYQVTYRGVFSLGQDLTIADVGLTTRRLAGEDRLRETRLEATSAGYPGVEALYPFRYRFRSWATATDARLLGFETYEKTHKQRHRLYLRDDSALGVSRLDPQDPAGRKSLAQLAAGKRPDAKVEGGGLFDRLGLLQQIRGRALSAQAEYRFRVTNGRDLFAYRVKVEGAQSLMLHGRRVSAWKLRIDGSKSSRNGATKVAHRPIYLWLNRAPSHVPLRLDSRHSVGLFRIELAAPALTRLSHQLPAAETAMLAVTRHTRYSRFDGVSAASAPSFTACSWRQSSTSRICPISGISRWGFSTWQSSSEPEFGGKASRPLVSISAGGGGDVSSRITPGSASPKSPDAPDSGTDVAGSWAAGSSDSLGAAAAGVTAWGVGDPAGMIWTSAPISRKAAR